MNTRHPYKSLERHKAWKITEKAIKDLVSNGDVEEFTDRSHIVGYILKKLQDAKALAPLVMEVNGVPNHAKQAQHA
ncbi:MAG TPA: hypothetical protein VM008_20575 [Phycisphaerae bacterium]|nr:hypothetical protein [Phycisphaerae bacterium]